MKKLLPFSYFLALLFSLSSCFDMKEDKDEVVPLPQATMSREIVYAYNEPQYALTEAYSSNSLQTYASLEAEGLNVNIGAFSHMGPDVIHFRVDKAKLAGGYVSTYSLKSLPNPAAGATDVLYSYRRDLNSTTMIGSSFSTLTGNLIITAYDAKNKLISGTFEVRWEKAFDPTVYNIANPDWKRCDIALSGSFSNLKIVE